MLVVAVSAQQRARRPKVTVHHRTENHKDHSLELMPDVTNHQVMKELRCSSCKVLSNELYRNLHSVHTAAALKAGRNPKPTHHELVHTLDEMCAHHNNKYALATDGITGKASTTVVTASDYAAGEHVQGLWLNKFMKHRCAHLLLHHEESILESHLAVQSSEEFERYMCVDWEHSCDGKSTQTIAAEALEAKKHEKRFGKRTTLQQVQPTMNSVIPK